MSTRQRSDDDFDREIRAHIAIETERLIEEGMSPDAARVAARGRFGNVTSARERFYEAGRLLWLDHLIQDLRCAARNMRRYPVASLVAVLSLAAGIGATTVTLTIRDVIFRKPPPLYQHPEQLSKIQVGSIRRPKCRGRAPLDGQGSVRYPLFPLVTIGILLTMAGIYGVLAFAIARRSRELALRVAVGAIATWIPSRRALKIDPVVLLHTP